MWYSSQTTGNRVWTNQSTVRNLRLIQNDIKFQCSIFIYLNRGFHIFVLTNFPLCLFSTLFCPYLTNAISYFNDFLPFLSRNLFLWRKFWGLTVEIAVTFLCVFGCSRRWPVTFDTILLLIYLSANDFLFFFTIT